MHFGIDLGTASTLVYVPGRGIVVQEPTVVAIDKQSGRIVAVGDRALSLLSRTPGRIVVIRPIREGVIVDYAMTEALLQQLIRRVAGRRARVFRPQVAVCIPTDITSVEKRAVLEAVLEAGAGRAYLIENPMAAAVGAGLEVDDRGGIMVVDVGAGTTEAAVIAQGGIVVSRSIRMAGNKMDEAVMRYLRKSYNLMIGEKTAEAIKTRIGSAMADGWAASMEIRGRDLIDGLPKTMGITSDEIRGALDETVGALLSVVQRVLELTPRGLQNDIVGRGITMTGGGALLRGLDRRLSLATGVPVTLAADPVAAVAIGTGKSESLL